MTKKQFKRLLVRYFEGFADRVDRDELSWSEFLAIFLLGGVIAFLLEIWSLIYRLG